MLEQWSQIFTRLCQQLSSAGLPSEWYILPNYLHYAPVTGSAAVDVVCLEALLGVSHLKPDHCTYAMMQVFDVRYPNLGLIALVERRVSDGAPNTTEQPVYNHPIDKKFSYTFLPIMHSALNALDPAQQNKSLLVQSYHARITFADLPQATVATVRLMQRFKADGQLGQVAVDFDDPLTVFIARLVAPLTARRKIHYLPRTSTPSTLQIPIRNSASHEPFLIGGNSTTLDQGFTIAQHYLDAHYSAHKSL